MPEPISTARQASSLVVNHLEQGIKRLRASIAERDISAAAASPFPYLRINGVAGHKMGSLLPWGPLTLARSSLFARSREVWSEATVSQSLRELDRELDRLPTKKDAAWVYTVLHLLKKYGSSVRASTKDSPFVSVYAETRTNAALAVCRLADEDAAYGLMVCLDLSGIQSFIYDVGSSKAYKSLKGRSYFVQAFLTQCSDILLREVRLTHTNLLYESGGKAFFLLPNTEAVTTALARAQRRMEDQAYYEEGGTLYPALGYVSFGDDTDLALLWKDVNDAAATQKGARYKRLLLANFDTFFGENSQSALTATTASHVCAVSGQPIPTNGGKQLDQESEQRVLPRVYDHIELGRRLKQTEFVLRGPGGGRISFHKLDSYLTLAEREPEARAGQLRDRLNATDYLPDQPQDGVGYGFAFYGGNEQPSGSSPNEAATLEDLCRIGEDRFAPLAVLRMDVDGLGQVFIGGIQDKRFAAYLTVSDRLETFFSGYLNEVRSRSAFRERVALLYAGGDDLFVVGRWDAVLAFAEEVREEFREFTERDDMTVSAGLFVTHHKFPIYRAAAEAGTAEHTAKQHVYKGQAKNAITLFGQALNWDWEFPLVKSLKSRMLTHIGQGLSRALLHHLRETYLLARPDPKSGRIDLSYKWQSAYRLSRLAERYRKQPAIKDFVEEVNKNLLHHATGAEHYLTLAAVAARWAEYELKLMSNGTPS